MVLYGKDESSPKKKKKRQIVQPLCGSWSNKSNRNYCLSLELGPTIGFVDKVLIHSLVFTRPHILRKNKAKSNAIRENATILLLTPTFFFMVSSLTLPRSNMSKEYQSLLLLLVNISQDKCADLNTVEIKGA